LLLAGFAGLLAWASWDWIVPPLEVKVVPVLVQTGGVEVRVGQELFKATGWIEPRPLPIDVPVQTEGMYRVVEVKINPGESVKAGQVLFRLDDAKPRLDLEASQKRLARRKAAVGSAEADREKARVTLQNAGVAIELTRKEWEAEVRTVEADVTKAQAMAANADLSLKVEEDLFKSGTVRSDVKVSQARLMRDVAAAEVTNAKAKLAKARTSSEVQVRLAETARAAAEADVNSLKAKVVEAEQEVADAEVEVKKAQLELTRTEIVAPVDGVVMQLNVRAGSMAGGPPKLSDKENAAVTLYEPKMLQVRVEVPIAKFQFVRYGHPVVVEIEDVLPGQKLTGTVLYDTHLANVARNSVPVKVSLPDEPPPQLRPEMIASVRFQAPATQDHSKSETVQNLVVPRRLLIDQGDAVRVWVVDPLGVSAELRTVTLRDSDKGRTSETVEVVSGLQASDKLIATGLEQLKPGSRIRIVGEAP
jgi:RND family efflux transporter MFP subunit